MEYGLPVEDNLLPLLQFFQRQVGVDGKEGPA